jgi:Lrp/AsnC family leucine-responsive transcriptional regulator
MMDRIDVQITSIIQRNGKTTQADIAKTVGLAPSAVLERLRKLEARGVIKEYVAVLDPKAFDLGLLAFVAVRSTDHGPDMPSAHALAQIPEVLEVHHVAGEDCYLLKVRARDAEHLGQLLRREISMVGQVTSTRTTIVLETVKETSRIPVGIADGATGRQP